MSVTDVQCIRCGKYGVVYVVQSSLERIQPGDRIQDVFSSVHSDDSMCELTIGAMYWMMRQWPTVPAGGIRDNAHQKEINEKLDLYPYSSYPA